ncbi:alpha-L-fucosidase [Streptomyces sp. NPDC051976]|uniref:alpha-L-fucosidase n=1 Tax=Streptomyces sp. NPDC051976 TaxID=3154947 RepID=UPI00343E6B87
MCEILGLHLRNPGLYSRLGELLTGMLCEMEDRGAHSAGVAVYGDQQWSPPGRGSVSRLEVPAGPEEAAATIGALPAEVRTSCPPGPEYAGYVDAHWRELIERYQPDILWNDMGYPGDPAELIRDYYTDVPEGIVNDRFWSGAYDVATPNIARRHEVDARPWEVGRPIGFSFGWNRQEGPEHCLTGTQLVHLLLDVVSKNGNLLVGVAPDDRGRIPMLQQRPLRELGRWLDVHGEAVYGTRPWKTAESTTQDGLQVRFTTTPDALYAHLLGPATGDIVITDLRLPVEAQVVDLASGEPVPTADGQKGTVFSLPAAADPVARVLRITPLP